MNEHHPSLTLWSQPLAQFSYLEFVTGRGGEQGPGGPVTNAIHTHHYFHYHRLIVLFVLNPDTPCGTFIGTRFRIHDENIGI